MWTIDMHDAIMHVYGPHCYSSTYLSDARHYSCNCHLFAQKLCCFVSLQALMWPTGIWCICIHTIHQFFMIRFVTSQWQIKNQHYWKRPCSYPNMAEARLLLSSDFSLLIPKKKCQDTHTQLPDWFVVLLIMIGYSRFTKSGVGTPLDFVVETLTPHHSWQYKGGTVRTHNNSG